MDPPPPCRKCGHAADRHRPNHYWQSPCCTYDGAKSCACMRYQLPRPVP